MKLHTNPVLLKELAEAIETAKGIPEAFVEKDYWLTTVLLELSLSPYRDLVVFKGGTSLSKAYGIIQRFSEDADLALIVQDLTGNQVKSRMDSCSSAIKKGRQMLYLHGSYFKIFSNICKTVTFDLLFFCCQSDWNSLL